LESYVATCLRKKTHKKQTNAKAPKEDTVKKQQELEKRLETVSGQLAAPTSSNSSSKKAPKKDPYDFIEDDSHPDVSGGPRLSESSSSDSDSSSSDSSSSSSSSDSSDSESELIS